MYFIIWQELYLQNAGIRKPGHPYGENAVSAIPIPIPDKNLPDVSGIYPCKKFPSLNNS